MPSKTLCSLLTAALLIPAAGIVPGQQAAPVPPSAGAQDRNLTESATIVRPSGELLQRLQDSKPRDALIKSLERMAKQREVHAQAFEEFDKRSQGTAQHVAIRNALAISWIGDTAQGLISAEILTEHYHQELVDEAERTLTLLVKRVRDIQTKSTQIESLAEQIVSGRDTEGNPLSAVQIEGMQKRLHEWMSHRAEMELHRNLYKKDLIFCNNELNELARLKQLFDGEVDVLEARVYRYLDAIEHGQKTAASKGLLRTRHAILNAVASLKVALDGPPAPQIAHPIQEPLGPGIGRNGQELRNRLTPEEKTSIEPELEAARRRLKGDSPALQE